MPKNKITTAKNGVQYKTDGMYSDPILRIMGAAEALAFLAQTLCGTNHNIANILWQYAKDIRECGDILDDMMPCACFDYGDDNAG